MQVRSSGTRSDTSLFTSDASTASRCRREKASNRPVSCEPRYTAPVARSIHVCLRFSSDDTVCDSKIKTALYRRQQIVEVMRDAAGELTDRLQLLRLHQRRLGVLPLGDLHLKAVVGDQQFLRAFGDARLEGIGVLAQILVAPCKCRGHVVIGLGDLAEFRTLILAVYRRVQIALLPAARCRQQRLRRPTDEAPCNEQCQQECTDEYASKPAGQHAGSCD